MAIDQTSGKLVSDAQISPTGPFKSAASLDYAVPLAPVDNTSKTSTAVTPAPAAPSTAPKGVTLPFTPAAQNSPVFDNSAGRQQAAVVKKQATDLASNLPTTPTAPSTAPKVATSATPSDLSQGFVSDEQVKADAAKQAAIDASKTTPGTIQQGPGGFQAASGTGQAQNQAYLDQQKQREADAATAKANIQASNDAASAAGVDAYYDESTGQWINSKTGMPQLPANDAPLTEGKYGMQKGDVIASGFYVGLTTAQADAVEAAAAEQKSKLDPQVEAAQKQAEEAKQTALIRGGQAGGFLSSQISGAAADHSVGGTWAGAGGTLKQAQDEYDKSIQQMKDEEDKAVETAKNYAYQAARTGLSQDLSSSENAAAKIADIKSAQDTLTKNHLDNLKNLSDIQKLERSDATDTISSLAANGYKAEDLPKQYLADLDKHLQAGGMPPGSASMLFATQAKIQAAQNLKDANDRQAAEVGNAKDIVGLLKDVPAGKSVTIGGQIYFGTNKGDVKTGTETDAQGKVTAWSFNPDDGSTVTTDLGYIGKPADGFSNVQTDQGWFSYNSKTGQAVPLQPSIAQTTWQAMFPNGTQSPYRSDKDPMQGQCGAFVNDLYGPNSDVHVGSTLKSKLDACSKYKVDSNDVQVGDTFIEDAGDTGHIGIVSGVKTGPNGKKVITALESNMVPPGGAKISTTRTFNADDAKVKMFARVPTDPSRLPPAGPDSPVTRAVMGGPTIGGKPLSQVFGISDAQQKNIDKTIALVKSGTLSSDTAMKRLNNMGLDPSAYSDDIKDAAVQGSLTSEQRQDALAKAKASLTATQQRTVNSTLVPLGYKNDPAIMGYKNARANITRVQAASNKLKELDPNMKVGSAVYDTDLLDGYIRMATGNAVTETQVDAIKNNQSKIAGLQNLKASTQYGGFLTPESRKQIVELSDELLRTSKAASDDMIKTYYQPELDQVTGGSFELNPDLLVNATDAPDTSSDDPLDLGLSSPDNSGSNVSSNDDPLGLNK